MLLEITRSFYRPNKGTDMNLYHRASFILLDVQALQ
jgi:hypothetical protein